MNHHPPPPVTLECVQFVYDVREKARQTRRKRLYWRQKPTSRVCAQWR